MLNLLFPKVCSGCSDILRTNEQVLCVDCRHHLPLACFHRNDGDTMRKIFFGKVKIEDATALLKFQKRGVTQELMHNLKYRGQQEIGTIFGAWLGLELLDSASFKNIDMVIPVPLHPHRKRKRGYNQVTKFGQEIAAVLQVPYFEDGLTKITKTRSQVFKKRLNRFSSGNGATDAYRLTDPSAIHNKHILLVDDIITTGATLENCASVLKGASAVKVSLATIAIA
jgi:ComF family protein